MTSLVPPASDPLEGSTLVTITVDCVSASWAKEVSSSTTHAVEKAISGACLTIAGPAAAAHVQLLVMFTQFS